MQGPITYLNKKLVNIREREREMDNSHTDMSLFERERERGSIKQ